MKQRKLPLRLIAAVSALAILAAACGGDDKKEVVAGDANKGGRLQVASEAALDCWNGLSYYGVSWSLFYFMARGLYGYPNTVESPATDELTPHLATDLPEVSDDGLTYTVELREGLKFNDGTDVDAGDVKATFERMLDPNIQCASGGPPSSGYYTVIEGVDEYAAALTKDPKVDAEIGGIAAVDDLTVEFHLTKADGAFVRALAMGWSFIIPAETERKITETPPPFVGPYLVSDYQTDQLLTIDREEKYWPGNVKAGVPEASDENNVDGLDLVIGVTPETELQQLKDSEIDISFDDSAPIGSDIPLILNDEQYNDRAFSDPDASVTYGYFRTDKAPFDNVALRQAVNYAVDRENIVKINGGEYNRSEWSEILPATLMVGSEDEKGTLYTFDPDAARQLIEDSGVETPIKATLVHESEAPGPETAAAIKENLEDIGFDVTLEGLGSDIISGYLDDATSPYHMAVIAWGQDYSDAVTFYGPLLSCPGGTPTGANYGNFCDEDFQGSLDEISAMPAGTERAQAYAQLSVDTMRDKAPWFPLLNRRKVSFVSERVGNYFWGPAKQFYFGAYYIKGDA
jgi:ABC-type transport system substrate-binding protein